MLHVSRVVAIGLVVCLASACVSTSQRPAPARAGTPPAPLEGPPLGAPDVLPPATVTPAPIVTAADRNDECAVTATAGEPIGSVALAESVDAANAPRPSNASERLVFRQLYETLIGADCQGRLTPGLASSWVLDPDGRTWSVTLREGAQFAGGAAVTATDVRDSWVDARDGGALHRDVRRLVESIVATGDRTLAIRLHSRRTDMPLALTHPHLAVAKTAANSPWPLGTRGAQIAADTGSLPAAAAAAMTLTRDGSAIRLLAVRTDPRDLLDHGVDVLLTRDPAALGYAATLPHFISIPLEWQRTYVLVAAERPVAVVTDDMRRTLAVDAVRGDARGAEGPFWWDDRANCSLPPTTRAGRSPTLLPRIVHEAADPVARDLAERFVGLAGGGASAPRQVARARGLTSDAFRVALRRGADAGYVVAMDTRVADPCRELTVLMEDAPWLDPATITPLVETRLHALVRRGRAGLIAEWDGAVRIVTPQTR